MNPLLAKKLIDMGAVRRGTTLQAYYNAHGLSGQSDSRLLEEFCIERAMLTKEGHLAFVAVGGTDKARRRFACEDIVSFDGMNAERMARTYCLSLEGADMSSGKRRGRRPRNAQVTRSGIVRNY